MAKFYTTFLLFFGTLIIAQSPTNSADNQLFEKYESYFELPRESIFVHLNKTSFIVGESVWFKSYVFDRHNSLRSKKTTNVNVGIYDENGVLIKNYLWFCYGGSGKGNIQIDSTFKTGEYYIKASTNWMKNFEENDAFIQKIRVISNDLQEHKPDVINTEYDMQFLPEGGHLITDVNNNVGFKIIDNKGQGVKVIGTIYDDSDVEITSFKSNTFGIGSFLFNPQKGKQYVAKITTSNSREITQDITNIEPTGIAIKVNSQHPEKVYVTVSTNKETLKSIKDKTYRLLLHKNGELKSLPFSFQDKITQVFEYSKSDLFKGVNTFTVFDENNTPLLERLIYINKSIDDGNEILISALNLAEDSVAVSISTALNKTSGEFKEYTDLSISVLPESTVGYDPDHNIISANRLKPYVKGYVEKASYYFTDITMKKEFELDLLLLTQGWSRYNWHSIFNNAPKALYEFENGVVLEGKIHSSEEITKIRIQEPKLIGYNWTTVNVKENNNFRVDNFFVIKDEAIRVSYVDKEGKLIKPKIYLNAKLNAFNDYISNEDLKYNNSIFKKSEFISKSSFESFFYNDMIELDEVLLEPKSKAPEKKLNSFGIKMNLLSGKDNFIQVTESFVRSFPKILDYIHTQGYQVSRASQTGGVDIINLKPITFKASRSPAVFLDDVQLTDFDLLLNMSTADFEGINVDKTGFGTGMIGANGVIRLYTRRTSFEGITKKNDEFAFTRLANNGFTESKSFYAPKYKSYRSDIFKYYGVIAWFPDVFVGGDKSQILKFPDTKSDIINFYIEGYDSQGEFVSQISTLNLKTSLKE
ncbi:hypothetical protein DFQ09_10657 [Winogradskyella pacifica]|uniref:TonB-dependent receptor-like protein n=1 Tax=Winogradskyella pacifica TaxID=664642 RepID=A0A3D9LPG8_9FLAO|nr:hypothetical protein [Winogradskyella pacifica]REE08590.1 hypothetical protein DFQ09_10657 [Winogradskyella pacifica]